MRRLFAVSVLLVALLAPFAALAVNPDEMLKDPALEARARSISENLRCLVCQNESIDDSNADLAHDLRVLVRQRLVAGDSDQQVMQYIVDRYGEFVLLRPVFAWHTLALWIAAPAALLAGIAAIIVGLRHRPAPARPSPMSPEEREALERLRNRGADG
ncbi:MAG TPA: cytochrome c-type biogenesis protein [Devosiaceae bacterium]